MAGGESHLELAMDSLWCAVMIFICIYLKGTEAETETKLLSIDSFLKSHNSSPILKKSLHLSFESGTIIISIL